MPTKHIVVCGLLGIIALGIGLFAPGFARASDPPARGYAGMDDCLYCHVEDAFADTLHPRKIRAPEAVLTTIIEGQEVSIFDSRTEGYETYVAPWAEYFNEDNVEFTIGGHWKQRFLTQIVPAEFSTGGDGLPIYSGEIVLPENYWVVMGIQWNVEHQRWQNYHGPTDENNWFMTPLRDPDDTTDRTWNKNCAGCHTT
ncbi:MAG: hypothetical protein GTN93_27915, partial [Anaerolineae bacterium]|nr:hypothetical protein [Anaerolineae bacterium]